MNASYDVESYDSGESYEDQEYYDEEEEEEESEDNSNSNSNSNENDNSNNNCRGSGSGSLSPEEDNVPSDEMLVD
eukprot:CAMPEP_0116888900 /NCGR_PEP_ID=MMETSP0463-20121206/24160_1 /TAXON_ID=181622 /ORGANISM="Strombidinopsis sp, Strain SopsisLIS2011" /LENGTH=74 /DNA_ID=CAMNT_0004554603 /DNA_START=713 /DNA_END=937 /DNA_ORIENTATION=+